jgi:hypothetical protein
MELDMEEQTWPFKIPLMFLITIMRKRLKGVG